ncbi:MAG: PRC-barrel domain-containing protein, partial [Solirubrobacterales bacterium]
MSERPAEGQTAELPSLDEALGWTGFELDDAGGNAVGRVTGVYVDAAGGAPVWLVVTLGSRGARRISFGRRSSKAIVVPLRECAAMPGRVWAA